MRGAVRRALRAYAAQGGADEPVVLVACSGGADSLALADAVAFIAPRLGLRAGLVTVDHGLQPGSADRAGAVATWGRAIGLDPVLVCPVVVAGRAGGPEAAAREARYEALVRAAKQRDDAPVLLGHTRDDQAETVLLALLRGSGARGLAAMPAVKIVEGVPLLRPLLPIARTQTRAACLALGLEAWEDPHNRDPAYARTQARELLELLSDRLGPAVVANLARTAQLAADDMAVIDELASAALVLAVGPDHALAIGGLAALPTAVRRGVLHAWLRESGVPGAALSQTHLLALDALIVDWHGQRGVSLPGGWVGRRAGAKLSLTPSAVPLSDEAG